MKHARTKALDQLEPLLERIRKLESLKEKKRGIFYSKSKAFLHFQEDPSGLYADLMKMGRFRVSTAKEQKAFLRAVQNYIN